MATMMKKLNGTHAQEEPIPGEKLIENFCGKYDRIF